MAGKTEKKSVKNEIPEAVPAVEENLLTGEHGGQEAPAEETVAVPEEEETPAEEIPEEKIFRITCRNKVSDTIGGVKFVDGTGYTKDSYSASWFANKDGYRVDQGK